VICTVTVIIVVVNVQLIVVKQAPLMLKSLNHSKISQQKNNLNSEPIKLLSTRHKQELRIVFDQLMIDPTTRDNKVSLTVKKSSVVQRKIKPIKQTSTIILQCTP